MTTNAGKRGLRIIHGLMEGQVLQRDRHDCAGTTITGACPKGSVVEARVLGRGRVIRGHDWLPASVEGGLFSITLERIPVGGPYQVELRAKRKGRAASPLVVKDLFVGDVWLLAGQSNMEGMGNMAHAPKPHPKVRAFYMRDEWGMAEEKLHWLSEAVDSVHNGYDSEPGRPPKEVLDKGRSALVKGVSPSLAFGIEMVRRTGVPQGLIPCAHGGTSMAQWSPELRSQGGASLYGAMMRRYEKLGQPVAGVLWYQGESDANRDAARLYTDNMIELVAATRSDMGLPKLPWFIVQLGCHACAEDAWPWNSIQEQQRRLPEVIDRMDVCAAVDLELDDGIHIGGKGQLLLGRRLARLADRLVHKARGTKAGVALGGVDIVPTPDCNPGAPCFSVEVSYRNVVGKLVGHGRPTGFALLDAEGKDVHGIYKTTVKGSRVLLHTNMPRHVLELLSVSYGLGRDPVCTIRDTDGMGVPVMQSVPLSENHMLGCRQWET